MSPGLPKDIRVLLLQEIGRYFSKYPTAREVGLRVETTAHDDRSVFFINWRPLFRRVNSDLFIRVGDYDEKVIHTKHLDECFFRSCSGGGVLDKIGAVAYEMEKLVCAVQSFYEKEREKAKEE